MDELAAAGKLPYDPSREDIAVTDDEVDAPDGALISCDDGWRLRVGDSWHPVIVPERPRFGAAKSDAERKAEIARVAALPRRAAHAVHALLEFQASAAMPATAAEVCVYDSEAVSVRATAAALTHARRLGLVIFTGRYWLATPDAQNLRAVLEDRFLAETDL
jgi:hypothetical protein